MSKNNKKKGIFARLLIRVYQVNQVLFLNYHSIDIGKKSAIYHVDGVYSVQQEAFRRQMQLIHEKQLPVISLPIFLEHTRLKKPFKENTLVITFDDGFLTDYEVAYPLLKQYGFSATFFICLSNVKTEDRWTQIKEMITDGFTIGSHTVSHPYLSDLEEADLTAELSKSKEILEEKTGEPIRYLAPPGGRFNAKVIQKASGLGYVALVSTQVGLNGMATDPWHLKRWTVRRSTTINEFEKMISQDKIILRIKILQSRVLNWTKKMMGNNAFDKIRAFLLPTQS